MKAKKYLFKFLTLKAENGRIKVLYKIYFTEVKFMKAKKYLFKFLTLIFIFSFSLTSFSSVIKEKNEIIKMVNSVRAENNLFPLINDKRLNILADKKAKIMADENNLSHTAGGYKSFSDIVKEGRIEYLAVGENIARNWKTPEEVMKAWLSSKGHRANI